MNYLIDLDDKYLLNKILKKSNSYFLIEEVTNDNTELKVRARVDKINNVIGVDNIIDLIIKYNFDDLKDLLLEFSHKIDSDRKIKEKFIIQAIKYNDIDLIDSLIESNHNIHEFLLESIENNPDLIDYFLEFNEFNDINDLLLFFIEVENEELIDKFIKLGANNWENALLKATNVGNEDILNKLIKISDIDYEELMNTIPDYGYEESEEYIDEEEYTEINTISKLKKLKKDDNDYYYIVSHVLRNSIKYNNIKLANYILKHIFHDNKLAFTSALKYNNIYYIKKYIDKISKIDIINTIEYRLNYINLDTLLFLNKYLE